MREPKLLHFIWLQGQDKAPAYMEKMVSSWRRCFTEATIRIWSEAQLQSIAESAWPEYAKRFQTLAHYVSKADVGRLFLLYEYGGIYIDADFECLRDFSALLDDADADFWSASEDGHYISIGIMGAKPKSEFVRFAIERLFANYNPRLAPNESTGPHCMTNSVRSAVGHALPNFSKQDVCMLDFNSERIAIFAPKLFYPYLYNQMHLRGSDFPDAVAVHHWAKAW